MDMDMDPMHDTGSVKQMDVNNASNLGTAAENLHSAGP